MRKADDSEPFAALAFKIMSDPYVGKLTYFRVYSGHARARAPRSSTPTKDRKERIGRILQMHANHREDKDAVFAGDIVAAVGLKNTTTGDTLCDPAHPIVLERMEFPEPVIYGGRSSRRPRPTRTSSARRSAPCPRRTRRSRSTPTTRPARRSSAAWASCTSRCWSTA